MKDRLFLIAILLIGGAALYFGLARPNVTKVPRRIRTSVEDLKPVFQPIELPPLVIPPIPAIEPPSAKDLFRLPEPTGKK